MRKVFMGVRLQRLREERGISQVALARTLGISASYLNQIERNQRPLTLAILLRINEQLGVDVQPFADDEAAQMIADVRDALVETGADTVSIAELRALSANMPGIARAVIEMHRRNRVLSERADTLTAKMGDGNTQMQSFALPQNHDEVRDYLNRRHNHIAELDTAAEAIFREDALSVGDAAPQLARRLADRHGVRVTASADSDLEKGRYDRPTRTLLLPDHLRPGQQAFQMAVQLAMLELPAALDALIAEGGFAGQESQRLARIGLANYFAGALVMPYGEFLQAAETMSYDIERLANRFGVGAEAICHRLSTLQRPGSPGLPFFFVRVDRAGNVSKRHSATDFHFSRVGGTCPLWIVYEAFSQPDRVLTQVASMPDGRTYFWIARQVVSGAVGYGRPQKTFAVGLGCDLRHAHRLVYSRGLDLQGPMSATPIGVGCKVCERQHCAQRASPSLLER
ncbi:MAG: short-chain fatty acyl-CoA regulator family protein [Pseudomonadota bacterium]|nr:short-chain fatty acyl-CoA regulator family protein [Pseudomonadota bacterium]